MSISSGAVLDLDNISAMIGSLTGSGTVTNTAASNTATLTLKPAAGSISTFSGIIQNGSTANVALTLNGNGTEVLTGSNTYTGTTTITAGTLQLGDGTSKNGSVAGKITDNAQLTFANPNAQTYSGMITGSGSLTKTGTGVLTLTGSNIYTGGTTVEVGILVAANGSNGSATGSGSVTLSGGTLASGSGGGSIAGEVEIGSLASEIAPGGIGSIGKLTIGSLLTASNLTTLNFDLTTPGGSGDLLVVTGNLALAPNTAITFGTDPTTLRRLSPDRLRVVDRQPQRLRSSRAAARLEVLALHDCGSGLYRPWWPCPSPRPWSSWASPPLGCGLGMAAEAEKFFSMKDEAMHWRSEPVGKDGTCPSHVAA